MSKDSGKALRYAYKLLSYRGRSRKELRQRLRQKGFEPPAVDETIERLSRSGFLDDAALAHNLRRRAEEVKLLGRTGAAMFMRHRGIPVEDADEALDGYDEGAGAMRLIESKLRSLNRCTPQVRRRRLVGHLRRRGYSSETVRKALNEYDREVGG